MAVDMEESLADAALPKHLARFILSAASCDNLWFVDPMSQGLIETLSPGNFQLPVSSGTPLRVIKRESANSGPLLVPPS